MMWDVFFFFLVGKGRKEAGTCHLQQKHQRQVGGREEGVLKLKFKLECLQLSHGHLRFHMTILN